MKCDKCGTDMMEVGGVTCMDTQVYSCNSCGRRAEEPITAGGVKFYGGHKRMNKIKKQIEKKLREDCQDVQMGLGERYVNELIDFIIQQAEEEIIEKIEKLDYYDCYDKMINEMGKEELDQHWSMVFADNIEKELIKLIKGNKE